MDANWDARMVLRGYLLNRKLRSTGDIELALEVAAVWRPDAVIIDGACMGGFEIQIPLFRRYVRKAEIIGIAEDPTDAEQQLVIGLGAFAYLGKNDPVAISALVCAACSPSVSRLLFSSDDLH